MKHIAVSLLPFALIFAACSSDAPGGDGAAGATSGSQAGSPGAAGAHAGGGAPNAAGAPATTAGAANSSGGAGNTAGAPATTAGAGGAPGSGGTHAGTGGTGGTGAGTAGSSMGGASTGTGGGAGATSTVSHLPVPPGAGNVSQPSGTPTKITTVAWAGFKGAVSFSFDDSNQSQIDNYAALNALGGHYTFFMWTGKTQASNAIWKTAFNDGHEIGNHTKSHSDTPSGDGDITAATTFISSAFNKPPYVFAAPSGKEVYVDLVKGLFFINRMVSDGLVAPNDNTDPWHLPTYIPPQGTAADTSGSNFKSEVDGAVSGNKWRTVCVHGFLENGNALSGEYQPVNLTGISTGISYAKTQGAWVDTISAVGSYWLGEKSFNAATSMTSGTDKTYTWTLPANFPPGHYIRVTTDGGVLKQGGTAIPWDSHGYYEVSLDAKSVTLSAQ